ncbi:ATP-binding protein [Aestuariirhabdus sp. LZHN29]|uniref:ATP-binding protein n=1 Tax=Aestuariirhabdus sp. LZHN29 TaxID=3417462 RepID=UPI003CF04E9F
MFHIGTVVLVMLAYVALLFWVARWAEGESALAVRVRTSSWVYSLSLAVFCTSWTFYGSVGLAANQGVLFLSLYLGATMAMFFAWGVLRKLVRTKDIYRVTSIADFISIRYNKSPVLAALVTLMCLFGITPYISLQLKAVIGSMQMLLVADGSGTLSQWVASQVDLLLVALMVVFTILFGVRHLDPTERHPGMMVALALESVIKLVAFLVAGIFICYVLFDGVGDLFLQVDQQKLMQPHLQVFSEAPSYARWCSIMLLGFFGVLLLPRQFHVAVVENSNESHIAKAQWLFPLYLLLINIFVIPIAMAGLLSGYLPLQADGFVLQLPLDAGAGFVSMLVFVGGFSAATGMIMISAMTLSTMSTNHLLLPIIEQFSVLQPLRRYLLQFRWLVVLLLMLAAYNYYLDIGESYLLVNIGLISFVAVLQFAPAVFLGLFWHRGNSSGAAAGLMAGFLVWAYTLMLPAFARSGWVADSILNEGLFGFFWLRPENLFGVTLGDNLTHAILFSLAANLTSYILVSLSCETDPEEQFVGDEIISILNDASLDESMIDVSAEVDLAEKQQVLMSVFLRYLQPGQADMMLRRCLQESELSHKPNITIVELARLERVATNTLSGSIGAAAAHQAVRHSGLFTPRQTDELSGLYSHMLAQLHLSPAELRAKIDHYRIQEQLLADHAQQQKFSIERLQQEVGQREHAEQQLTQLNEELEERVSLRTRDLETANSNLKQTLEQLQETQFQLVERDKMAALGGLVAGVAHEVNTPIGISITAITHLLDVGDKFYDLYQKGELKKSDFDKFFLVFSESSHIINNNVQRAADLVKSFKQVAVDQISEQKRRFNCRQYIEEVLLSLRPQIKKTSHRVDLLCDDKLEINSYPGVISQILTNLVMNSLLHAFEPDESGSLVITVTHFEGEVQLTYSDDGRGMSEQDRQHIFDPFFTSKRSQGGSGLGAHIVYNLVTQQLNGTIHCYSDPGEGVSYHIIFPEMP